MFTRYLTVDILTRSVRNFWEKDFAKNVQPGQRRFGGEDTLTFWLTWRWEVGDCADDCRTLQAKCRETLRAEGPHRCHLFLLSQQLRAEHKRTSGHYSCL